MLATNIMDLTLLKMNPGVTVHLLVSNIHSYLVKKENLCSWEPVPKDVGTCKCKNRTTTESTLNLKGKKWGEIEPSKSLYKKSCQTLAD